jgi:hypothetical protein
MLPKLAMIWTSKMKPKHLRQMGITQMMTQTMTKRRRERMGNVEDQELQSKQSSWRF